MTIPLCLLKDNKIFFSFSLHISLPKQLSLLQMDCQCGGSISTCCANWKANFRHGKSPRKNFSIAKDIVINVKYCLDFGLKNWRKGLKWCLRDCDIERKCVQMRESHLILHNSEKKEEVITVTSYFLPKNPFSFARLQVFHQHSIGFFRDLSSVYKSSILSKSFGLSLSIANKFTLVIGFLG